MKILLINKFYYLKGGTEKHFFELKDVLEKNGHEVIVLSTQNDKNNFSGKNEYFIPETKMHLSNFLNGLNLFYNFRAIKELKKIIAEHNIDVAHLHNVGHHFSPAIIKFLKKKNIPVVMTVHDYKIVCPNYKLFNQGKTCEKCQGGKFYHCLAGKCVKNSHLASLVLMLESYWAKWKKYYDYVDYFIVPSQFMKMQLMKNGIEKNKIKYLPNFLDEEKLEKNESGEMEKYILFFGRLSQEKGISVLIEAMRYIKNENIKLKIAGDGEELFNLKKQAEKLKLENQVEFLGYQNKEQVKKLIANSQFVVVPSVWYENAPYSVLESFSQAKPVIGSRIGGIEEIIIDGKTGLLFNPGNAKDLAEKINFLWKNPQEIYQMGSETSEFFKEKFGSKKYYQGLEKIYSKLSGSKNIDKKPSKC